MEALKHNFFLSGYFKKRGYEDSGDLAANRIVSLPQGTPQKIFTLHSQRALRWPRFGQDEGPEDAQSRRRLPGAESIWSCGHRGFRGMDGDTQKDLVLTEAGPW
jgi:hypothetical protein